MKHFVLILALVLHSLAAPARGDVDGSRFDEIFGNTKECRSLGVEKAYVAFSARLLEIHPKLLGWVVEVDSEKKILRVGTGSKGKYETEKVDYSTGISLDFSNGTGKALWVTGAGQYSTRTFDFYERDFVFGELDKAQGFFGGEYEPPSHWLPFTTYDAPNIRFARAFNKIKAVKGSFSSTTADVSTDTERNFKWNTLSCAEALLRAFDGE